MALVPLTVKVGLAPVGRLKFQAHDLIGAGSLSGIVEPELGWLLCNGAAIPNSGVYAALYAMVGTKFGAAGTLPPLLDGRVPIPKGSSWAIGQSGGEILHTVTLAEYPSHNHSRVDGSSAGQYTNQANKDGFSPNNYEGINRATDSTGGGGSHNNMPLYQVVGYCLVKY